MVATQLNHMKCHFISSTGQHTVWLECIWIAFNAALNINVGMLQLAEWQSTRCEVDILKLHWILHRAPIYYNVVQDFTRTLFLPLSFEWYSSECKHSCHWILKNIQCNGKICISLWHHAQWGKVSKIQMNWCLVANTWRCACKIAVNVVHFVDEWVWR